MTNRVVRVPTKGAFFLSMPINVWFTAVEYSRVWTIENNTYYPVNLVSKRLTGFSVTANPLIEKQEIEGVQHYYCSAANYELQVIGVKSI